MGIDYLPKPKIWDAQDWIDAQEKFLYGTCTSRWHRFFYKDTKQISSKEKADGSSASLYLCKKCNGIRDAWVTVKFY